MLGLTVQNDWELQAINIKMTLLKGTRIDREVFVIPMPESNTQEGYPWKLNKCINDLSNASLKWYSRVQNVVNSKSRTISKVDPSLFYGIIKVMRLLDIFLCMLMISYSQEIQTFLRQ